MICCICNTEQDLRTHLRVHKISAQTYYNTYIGKPGHCKTCGKTTKFISIQNGYRSYCCNTCAQNNSTTIGKRIATLHNNPSAGEKRKLTWKLKTAAEKTAICEKIAATCKQRYGVESYSQTDAWHTAAPEKISAALKALGPAPHKKTLDTCIQKYGMNEQNVSNIAQLDVIKAKIHESCIRNHGGMGFSSKTTKAKADKTHKEKTGFSIWADPNIQHGSKTLYEYDGYHFDSYPELAFYIWCIKNEIAVVVHPHISFEYEYDGQTHTYHPDFKVDDEYVEIKGLHFFENKDPNGKMINPFARSQDGLYEAKHQCMIANGIRIITDYDAYL